jgi:hypothetical protein
MEDCLDLRPLKLESVIAESDSRLKSKISGVPVPVKIDWEKLKSEKGFVGNSDYVQFVRELCDCAIKITSGSKGKNFRDVPVPQICKENGNVAKAMGSALVIRFDFANKTSWHPNRSKTLAPKKFLVAKEGDVTVVTLNEKNRSTPTCCGIPVEWCLDKNGAKNREDAEIKRLETIHNNEVSRLQEERANLVRKTADQRLKAEENRRSQEAKDMDKANREAEKDYSDAIKAWEKAPTKIMDKCPHCGGRGENSCQYCHGSKSGKCKECSGGKRSCTPCKGTGEKEKRVDKPPKPDKPDRRDPPRYDRLSQADFEKEFEKELGPLQLPVFTVGGNV